MIKTGLPVKRIISMVLKPKKRKSSRTPKKGYYKGLEK